jgi:20S proteasome alpha/beta subunit
MQMHTGTSILAIRCTDGVLLAADSRASMGRIIAATDMQKLMPVSDRVWVAQSGAASACQLLSRAGREYSQFLAMDSLDNERIAVSKIAHALRRQIQKNKAYLTVQLLLAGIDDTGPHVFALMQSGMQVEREIAIGGSGSLYITSYCDEYFQRGMNLEQARDFAITALNLAMLRDGFSGGPIEVVAISEAGCDRKLYTPDKQPYDNTLVKT